MNPHSCGATAVRKRADGTLYLTIPLLLPRRFALTAGDTITWTNRKAGGAWLRFYRRSRLGWLRLLPDGMTRKVKHPQ